MPIAKKQHGTFSGWERAAGQGLPAPQSPRCHLGLQKENRIRSVPLGTECLAADPGQRKTEQSSASFSFKAHNSASMKGTNMSLWLVSHMMVTSLDLTHIPGDAVINHHWHSLSSWAPRHSSSIHICIYYRTPFSHHKSNPKSRGRVTLAYCSSLSSD